MADTARWMSYEFDVLPKDTIWGNFGGVYIFAGFDRSQSQWVAYYVGETGDFSDRMPSHEKWFQARQLGATHVHARLEPQVAARAKIEAELIQRFDPHLNKQYR